MRLSTHRESTARCARPRMAGWGLGRIVYAASSAQLRGWLDEWGVPPGPVASLSINEVAPDVATDGPAPELTEEIKALQRARFVRDSRRLGSNMDTPAAVQRMIEATNAADRKAFVASFTEDAYLEDWGREVSRPRWRRELERDGQHRQERPLRGERHPRRTGRTASSSPWSSPAVASTAPATSSSRSRVT